MVHPKVSNYHVLRVSYGEGKPADTEAFIGRIDGAYHLLGYRPVEVKYMFSENECASLDLGIVELPEGKRSISDLVRGDVIKVKGDGEPYEMIHDRFV